MAALPSSAGPKVSEHEFHGIEGWGADGVVLSKGGVEQPDRLGPAKDLKRPG